MGWTPDGTAVLFRSLRDADGVALGGPPLHRARSRAGCRRRCRCRPPAPATSRPTASASSTRRSSATSAPGSATRAAGRRTSTSSTSPRADAEAVRGHQAHRARPDVDRRRDLLRLRPRRHAQPLLVRPRRRRRSRKLTNSTTWDVRWPSSDNVSRIVYELDGELHVFDVTHEGRPARSRSSCPTTASRCGPRASRPRRTIEDFELQPEGRAGALRGPRRRLHGADREGPDAQPDRTPRRPRQVGALVARRQAHRVHLRPQRRGRGLAGRPGGRQARGSSPRAARPCATPRSGRRTARARLLGQGRQALRRRRWPTGSWSRSPTTRAGTIRDYAWSPKGAYLAFSMSDPNGLALAPHLERRGREGAPRHGRALQRGGAELGSRGRVPLLPERPRVRARRSAPSSGTSRATA